MPTDEAVKYKRADAGDPGLRFLFPGASGTSSTGNLGGLLRPTDHGSVVTIAGRGGTGKSILALQFAIRLLAAPDEDLSARPRPAAFYFSLEAPADEIKRQLLSFPWGIEWHRRRHAAPRERGAPHAERTTWDHNGLHVRTVPSPVPDLTSLVVRIRQQIAASLRDVTRLVAIVVDPVGGVALKDDLRGEISQIRDLAESHRTFLFLLAEDHVLESHRSIEHYSHAVIHLEHAPDQQPARRLYVQKARIQPFRAGYHQLELLPHHGVRVYPSVSARSAAAHDVLAGRAAAPAGSASASCSPLFSHNRRKIVPLTRGAVALLMGPPGGFKEFMAVKFCLQEQEAKRSSLYISFKTELQAVAAHMKSLSRAGHAIRTFPLYNAPFTMRDTTWFLEARSPLHTPEEILSRIGTSLACMENTGLRPTRAVVWGLRRLNDMPNFSGQAVQFLEALVVLLKSHQITSLLVDWPEQGQANTLPIVDLSGYVLLTRLCRSVAELSVLKDRKRFLQSIWRIESPEEATTRENVTMLRVQRDEKGFHRDQGWLLYRERPRAGTGAARVGAGSSARRVRIKPLRAEEFETLWSQCGWSWEAEPGLGAGLAPR